MAMSDVSVLYVRLHEKIIGTLTRVAGDRSLFSFNQEYINDSDRSTLSLCFKDVFGELRTDVKPLRCICLTKTDPFTRQILSCKKADFLEIHWQKKERISIRLVL